MSPIAMSGIEVRTEETEGACAVKEVLDLGSQTLALFEGSPE
jgi:hypothetical protein